MDSQIDAKRKRMSYEPEDIKLPSILKNGIDEQAAPQDGTEKGIALQKAISSDRIKVSFVSSFEFSSF